MRRFSSVFALFAAVLLVPAAAAKAGLFFQPAPGPNGADVRALAVSSGTLFAGTYRGVWTLSDRATWAAAGLSDRTVSAVATAGGNVFAATGDAVWLYGGGQSWSAETLPGTDGFRTVLVTDGTTLWAAGRTVAKRSGGVWSALPAISGIAVSGTMVSGDPVVGLVSGGALRLVSGVWVALKSGLGPSEAVLALLWDGGTLWAGTSRALYAWNGVAWAVDTGFGVHDVRGLSTFGGVLRAATADAGLRRRAGSAWVAEGGGFVTLATQAFATDGSLLYLGTNGGPVYVWDGSSWVETPFGAGASSRTPLPASVVTDIASTGVETDEASVLITAKGGGVAPPMKQLPSGCGGASAAAPAPDGSVDAFLVATNCGVFSGGAAGGTGGWTAMNAGFPSGVVPGTLAKTPYGTWAGTTSAGLFRYSAGGWTPDVTAGLPQNGSVSVLRALGNSLYLAGAQGAYARTGFTSWSSIGDGLPSAGTSVTSFAGSGSLFAGLPAGGVYRRDGNGPFRQDAAGLASSPVWSLDTAGEPGSQAAIRPGAQLFAAAGTAGVMVKRSGGWMPERAGLPAGIDARVVRTTVRGTGASPNRSWVRVGTAGSGVQIARADAEVRMVPVVLDLVGATGSRFRTELTLGATTGTTGRVALTYTPASGFGQPGDGGTSTIDLGRGELRAQDALAFLRLTGIPIGAASASNPVAGTLSVAALTPSGAALPADQLYLVARTYTGDVSVGTYGLFYDAPSDVEAAEEKATVYGLRRVAGLFRSNLAVAHVPTPSRGGGAIQISVQVFGASGAAAGSPMTRTLAPGEWTQLNDVLGLAGLADGSYGYAVVTRTSGVGPFVAYGVVNDIATSDGSFLPAFRPGGVTAARRLVVPVVLDVLGAVGSHYTTELTLANDGPIGTPVDLVYQPAPGFGTVTGVPSVTVTLATREQRTIPDVIAFLRANGMVIPDPAAGGPQAGTLSVHFRYLDALDTPSTVALARTSTPNPDASVGGSFGLFYAAVARGGGARTTARIPALTQNAAVRSNLAVVHTGGGSELPITLSVQLYDSATANPAGTALSVTLQPGDWFQWAKVLETTGALATTSTAYAVVTRTSGDDTFFAYGIVNDNVTSDGSFVPMIPAETN